MKTIGIKLADGSFYPVLQEGTKEEKQLDLTTAHNNQTRVMVDMYRSRTCTIEDAEYVDTLQIDNLIAHPNGEADISFTVSLDEENNLFAKIVDSETGAQSKTTITLVSRTLEERLVPDNYEIKETPTIEESLDISEEQADVVEESVEEEPIEGKSEVVAAAAGAIAGGGLLAAAMSIKNKIQKDEEEVVEPEEPVDVIEEDPTIAEFIEENAIDESELQDDLPESFEMPADAEIPETDSADIFAGDEIDNMVMDVENATAEVPDFSDFETTEEPVADEIVTEEAVSEEPVADETDIFNTDDLGDLSDLDIPETTEEPSVEETDIFSTDDLDNVEIPEETEAPAESEDLGLDDFGDLDLPDMTTEDTTDIFNMDDLDSSEPVEEDTTEAADETDIFNTDDLGDFGDFNIPEISEEPAVEETDIFSTDDFDNVEIPETTEAATETEDLGLDNFGDLDLPDITAEDTADIFNMDDLDSSEPVPEETTEAAEETDIFNTDDLGDIEIPETTEESDIFSTDDLDDFSSMNSMDSTLVAADPFNFEGLYDTSSSVFDEEETTGEENSTNKKTRIPVIICIVCAIICLIATTLVLFIIPSKYNLIGKDKNTEKAIIEDTPVYEEPEDFYIPEPEIEPEPYFEEPEEVPQAKEDEIVVIEEAEKVVPVIPEVVEEKPADISYKIKWGDTLWDIADTYYKNPWKYKKIANYNGIKNPDYIISGTIIAIPAE